MTESDRSCWAVPDPGAQCRRPGRRVKAADILSSRPSRRRQTRAAPGASGPESILAPCGRYAALTRRPGHLKPICAGRQRKIKTKDHSPGW